MDLPNQTPSSTPPRKKIFLLSGLAILGGCFVIGAYQILTTPRVTRSVTVVGTGKKTVIADKAIITYVVSINSQDKTLVTSVGENLDGSITRELRALGITNFKVVPYQVTPQYNRISGVVDTSSIRGYQYASGGQITVEGQQNITKALAVLSKENITIAQTRYVPDDEKLVESEVRSLAIEDARMKAEAMAKSARANLGKIITLTEQPNSGQSGTAVSSSNPQTGSEIEIQSSITATFEVK